MGNKFPAHDALCVELESFIMGRIKISYHVSGNSCNQFWLYCAIKMAFIINEFKYKARLGLIFFHILSLFIFLDLQLKEMS